VLLVSFNAHTCVSDQECFIPRTTMAIVPGEKAAYKRLNPTAANLPPLSLAALVAAAAAVVLRVSSVILVLSRATT
jgi:hypothetical protein